MNARRLKWGRSYWEKKSNFEFFKGWVSEVYFTSDTPFIPEPHSTSSLSCELMGVQGYAKILWTRIAVLC